MERRSQSLGRDRISAVRRPSLHSSVVRSHRPLLGATAALAAAVVAIALGSGEQPTSTSNAGVDPQGSVVEPGSPERAPTTAVPPTVRLPPDSSENLPGTTATIADHDGESMPTQGDLSPTAPRRAVAPAQNPKQATPGVPSAAPEISQRAAEDQRPRWSVVFDGYGSVSRRNNDRMLTLEPKISETPLETHAALVASETEFGDVEVRARLNTIRQLRVGSTPNPWEVGWLLWRYSDNTRFYSLVLKPNGWELGKEDPAYPGAQRFLATGETPFPIGRWYDLRVTMIGNTIDAWVDGEKLVSYTDRERPYSRGAVGLYTEDSAASFEILSVQSR